MSTKCNSTRVTPRQVRKSVSFQKYASTVNIICWTFLVEFSASLEMTPQASHTRIHNTNGSPKDRHGDDQQGRRLAERDKIKSGCSCHRRHPWEEGKKFSYRSWDCNSGADGKSNKHEPLGLIPHCRNKLSY